MHPRVLLLTGATGFLGNELLRCYLESPSDTQIRVLVRGDGDQAQRKFASLVAGADEATRARFSQRVTPVWGDLQLPRLGMDDEDYRTLAAQVTRVVNSAAAIDFALPLDAVRGVNLGGTKHLVEFALACPNLQAFAHISTAHVAGKRTGWIAEDELEHAAGFVNSYEQSKYEAEEYLHAQMADLPIAIYRSTTLIGDARTGAVRQFNFFHNAVRFLYHGLFPALPGVPDGHLDFIPVDWAARAIQYLAEDNFHPGTTYHICAEPAQSFTLQNLIDATYDCFAASPASKKKHIKRIPIVDQDTFEQIIAHAKNDGHGRIAQAVAPMNYFLPHLSLPKVFDATHLRRDLRDSGRTVPVIRTYYAKVIDYCLETDWGRRQLAWPLTPQTSDHS
jgi:thioester reductase-like protein